jgi:hypothetical protein
MIVPTLILGILLGVALAFVGILIAFIVETISGNRFRGDIFDYDDIYEEETPNA